nr:MAG TPA: hypothetical protein [Caudoviricetes sp.]
MRSARSEPRRATSAPLQQPRNRRTTWYRA